VPPQDLFPSENKIHGEKHPVPTHWRERISMIILLHDAFQDQQVTLAALLRLLLYLVVDEEGLCGGRDEKRKKEHSQ